MPKPGAPWEVESHRYPTLSDVGTPVWDQNEAVLGCWEGRPRGLASTRIGIMRDESDGAARGWIPLKASLEALLPTKHRRPGAHCSSYALPQVPNCSENIENVQSTVATSPQRRTEARTKASKGRAGALQREFRHAAAA